METAKQLVRWGAAAWAVIIVGVAVLTFREVNTDARLLVVALTVVSTFASLAASRWANREQFGWAGVSLLVSVVAPTYFLWIINLLPAVLASLAFTILARDRREAVAPH